MAEKIIICIACFWLIVGLIVLIDGLINAIRNGEFFELAIITVGLISILAVISVGIVMICEKM